MQEAVGWIDANRWLFSLLVVVVALGLRQLGIGLVRRSTDILSAEHRRRISIIHHTSVVLPLVLLVALWLPQIQEFALSITALAVALVIATKELLLCLIGAVVSRTANAFAIGDWISVQGQFGEVIEKNLLSTQIQEVESRGYTYTGRTIVIPNSLFLSSSVINQNFLRRYQFHSFSITIEPDAFPIDAEEKLVARIRALTEPFAATARRYNAMLEKRTGIDIPDARPLVEFSTNDLAKIVTTITVFCPTDRIVALEREMVREFFDWYRAGRRREDVERASHKGVQGEPGVEEDRKPESGRAGSRAPR